MSTEQTEPSKPGDEPAMPIGTSEDDWSDDYADYDIRDTIERPTN